MDSDNYQAQHWQHIGEQIDELLATCDMLLINKAMDADAMTKLAKGEAVLHDCEKCGVPIVSGSPICMSCAVHT